MKRLIFAFIGSMIMSASGNTTEVLPQKEKISTKQLATSSLHSIRVTDAAGLLMNGILDVKHFITGNGRLWAVCKLKGIIGNIDIDEDCVVSVTIGDCDDGTPRELNSSADNNSKTNSTNCDCITIRFGGCTIPRLVGAIELNPNNVSCAAPDYPVEIICNINRECKDDNIPRERIASLLNQLL